jgi:hypothetical protein
MYETQERQQSGDLLRESCKEKGDMWIMERGKQLQLTMVLVAYADNNIT